MITVIFYKNHILSEKEQIKLFDDILAYLPNKTFADIEPMFDGCIMREEPDPDSHVIYNPPYKFEQLFDCTLITISFDEEGKDLDQSDRMFLTDCFRRVVEGKACK